MEERLKCFGEGENLQPWAQCYPFLRGFTEPILLSEKIVLVAIAQEQEKEEEFVRTPKRSLAIREGEPFSMPPTYFIPQDLEKHQS